MALGALIQVRQGLSAHRARAKSATIGGVLGNILTSDTLKLVAVTYPVPPEVARTADSITVAIELVCIGDIDAVIAHIADAVLIAVELIGVGDGRAIVDAIREAVFIRIGTGGERLAIEQTHNIVVYPFAGLLTGMGIIRITVHGLAVSIAKPVQFAGIAPLCASVLSRRGLSVWRACHHSLPRRPKGEKQKAQNWVN